MADYGATEVGISENVVFHEDGITDATDYIEQPSTAVKNPVKRKKFHAKRQRPSPAVITAILFLVISLTLVFLFNSFYSLYSVLGPSMEPTLSSGQSIVLAKDNALKHNRIIVFHKPSEWGITQGKDDVFIKRIYAIPGDTISFENETFSVNGTKKYTLPTGYSCISVSKYSHVLKENEIFVMGDNVSQSLDSRRVFCDGHPEKSFVTKGNVIGYGNVVLKF